jgi:hypothetical protein
VAWGEAYADRLLTSPMGAGGSGGDGRGRPDVGGHPDALWSFVHVAALARKE